MSLRTDLTGTAGGGGICQRLGDLVVRWPWVVIGCWAVLAVVLPLSFPSLTEMAQRNPVAILPADAPVTVTAKQMTEAFNESGSENILLVVLTNDKGLNPADEGTYRRLVDKLRGDARDVVMLQDFLSTPPLREVLASKDQKAWILPIGLAGELGTPQSYAAYTRVADIVNNTVAGTTLTANLTGPAATVADLTDIGEKDRVSDRDCYRSDVARHPADHLPKPRHHIAAAHHNRRVPIDCTGRGSWHRPTGPWRFQPDHYPSQRHDRRCGNRLRGLSDQSLSRLRAARR